MSEQEKKNINEMDAAEMLEQHRSNAPRKEQPAESWAADLIREFEADAKAWHHRKGWEAAGLMLLSAVTVGACAAALIGAVWQPIVAGIGAVNLMMAGAWWQKAKEGWSA